MDSNQRSVAACRSSPNLCDDLLAISQDWDKTKPPQSAYAVCGGSFLQSLGL